MCVCHAPEPEGVETPTPEEPAGKQVTISWFHTETFTATVTVEEDFDLEAEDADEELDEIICGMSTEELSAAFTGCTEREITSKKEEKP